MSPSETDGLPTSSAAPSSDASPDAEKSGISPEGEGHVLTDEETRSLVRLVQCPLCFYVLREPVTLPCGRTLCKRCVPETHLRTNVSYPATENRLQGFKCPFQDCQREHALGDCGLDVSLNNILSAVKTEYDVARKTAFESELVTLVSAKGEWEIAGIPSLNTTDNDPKALPGGKLLATYLLVDMGDLTYNAEAAYGSPDTDAHRTSDAALFEKIKEAAVAEINCDVCYAVFYDAVTTPCGHTFCRECLQRVLDHAGYCPVCRRRLTIQPVNNRAASPANDLLKRITAAFCPDLVELRARTISRESFREDDEFDMSIFVCTLAFPFMPTFLHVFEPRYRLMVRQALEGDRTFGMVMYDDSAGGFAELGTLLRIVNVQFFPDGRSLLETVGVSRFRIVRYGMVDGYTVAKTERINDISIAEEEQLEALETAASAAATTASTSSPAPSGGPEGAGVNGPASFPTNRTELETMSTQALMDFAIDFVRRMGEENAAWLTLRKLTIYGECPRDPALFPWWFVNILPVPEDEKYWLLGMTSVRERLKLCCRWILSWESNRW